MKFHSAALVLAATAGVVSALDGYGPLPSEVAVGDEICVYGFAMDEWCIVDTGGTLLDMPSVTTLLNPEMHSFHCLLDVGVCVGSPYHILVPPGEGETMYGTGWQLASNDMVIEAGRALGSKDAGCTTCGDTGMQERGLRVSVTGTVVTTDPPVLEVTSVTALEGDAMGCMDMDGGGGGDTGETPTVAPTVAAAVVVTEPPTDTPSSLAPSTTTTVETGVTTDPPMPMPVPPTDVPSTQTATGETTDPPGETTDPPVEPTTGDGAASRVVSFVMVAVGAAVAAFM
jgi:hypothetical protein